MSVGWGTMPKPTIRADLRRLRELLTPPMTTADREAALRLVDELLERKPRREP